MQIRAVFLGVLAFTPSRSVQKKSTMQSCGYQKLLFRYVTEFLCTLCKHMQITAIILCALAYTP